MTTLNVQTKSTNKINISQIESVQDKEFLVDVIKGLSQKQKTLPCKYFYDESGSQLFEKICQLDEYYVTRMEIDLLTQSMQQIVQALPDNCNIIEPGSGAGIKIQMILNALDSVNTFTPLEISASALNHSEKTIKQKFPQIKVNGVLGDFTDKRNILKIKNKLQNNNVVFFPGSTIGNFETNEAKNILENLAFLAQDDGKILIGVDLIKPLNKLLKAYNDKEGITARFNLNLLERINNELHGDFILEHFEHISIFNSEKSRIEMHLKSKVDHSVKINGIRFHFKNAETIHTENSHKYTIDSFTKIARSAGLSITQSWLTQNNEFGIFLLQKS